MSPTPKAPKRTRDALKFIATVAQTIPQKMQQFRITSASTSRKLSCEYAERHKQIFPGGFDITSSSSSTQRPCYSFTPEQLYDILTSGYSPENHVEHIIVKSASYCKKNTAPKHEFIILEVEDTKSPGLRNFIALDRNNSDASNHQSGCISMSSSQSFVAKDEFRVSYDGDRTKLLAQCDLRDHETLETLIFRPDDPLLFYQLVTLARTVSSQCEKYHVFKANCYWFGGLIWECILRMRPSAQRNITQGQIRGAFHIWLRQSTNAAELDLTYGHVDEEIVNIERKLTILKQGWTRVQYMEKKDELEALKRRVRELEELDNTRPDPYLH